MKNVKKKLTLADKNKLKSLEKSAPKPCAYKVPQKIYERAVHEISAALNRDQIITARARCHRNTIKSFNCIEGITCPANFLEAAKQSLEDRNFKTLYEIINRALEIRDISLFQQVQQVTSHNPMVSTFY